MTGSGQRRIEEQQRGREARDLLLLARGHRGGREPALERTFHRGRCDCAIPQQERCGHRKQVVSGRDRGANEELSHNDGRPEGLTVGAFPKRLFGRTNLGGKREAHDYRARTWGPAKHLVRVTTVAHVGARGTLGARALLADTGGSERT